MSDPDRAASATSSAGPHGEEAEPDFAGEHDEPTFAGEQEDRPGIARDEAVPDGLAGMDPATEEPE